jgi:hypothetical protein
MSGPSWPKTSFDFAAAARSCSRSKVPTLGISRSMTYLRNGILLSFRETARDAANGSLATPRHPSIG